MNRLLFSILFLCFTARTIACPNNLADSNGQPSASLLEVLSMFQICHDGTWPSIQKETEKAWMGHGRNTDLQDVRPIPNESLRKTYDLFTALDMTQNIVPQKNCFDYGGVHGSWASRVRDRFWFLKELWDRGVRFSTLVFWTGDRDLDPQRESEKVLLDQSSSPYPFRRNWKWHGPLPKNETEMLCLIFDQLDLPQEWRRMPLMIADAPKPQGMKRPHTEDAFQTWLAMNPYPGSILAATDQPFVCRQHELLLGFLPSNFSMETVGPGFTFELFEKEKHATAILLAELAYRIKLFCQRNLVEADCNCLIPSGCL